MTMVFRTVKAALVQILGNYAPTLGYRVTGYQGQSTEADTVSGTSRKVSVVYTAGSFPKSGSSPRGPVRHEMEFSIELLCSARASGNLAALSNPESTDEQKAQAIAAFVPAAQAVDALMDSFIDAVYQVLMDNRAIRLDDGTNGDLQVSNRWISRVQKDDPLPSGALAVMSATITYNVVATESLTGAAALEPPVDPDDPEATPDPATVVVDLLIEGDVDNPVEGDENEGRAGVELVIGPLPEPEVGST